MALKPIEAHCNKCNANFTQEPKRSFLGFQKLVCSSCNEKLVYPLTTGYRITYWVLVAFMALSFANALSQGGIAFPGVLGIAIIIALIQDWRIKKRVSGEVSNSSAVS